MNLLYAQYTPLFLTVIVVGLGVIYTSLRLTSIKDVILQEGEATRARLSSMETTLRADIARMARRTDPCDRQQNSHS